MTSLLDVNVLLPLAWTNHPHHEAANRWFEQRGEAPWATCLITQSAFFRLSMNPAIVNVTNRAEYVLSSLEELIAHPKHTYLASAPLLLEGAFVDIAPSLTGYRQVTDATLLHIAAHHGASLVTFDAGIAHLAAKRLDVEVLRA